MSVKVAYIAGLPRSGSTILANLIGQLPGCFYGGELHHFWGRGVLENRTCGCGAPFHECPIWSDVWASVVEHRGEIDLTSMRRIKSKHMRTRQMASLVARKRAASTLQPAALHDYRENVQALYRAIHDRIEGDIIVDSSKSPAYAYLLADVPDLDVYVIHLVRDPRANSYVWLRRHGRSDGTRGGLISRSIIWDVWHVACELLWREQPTRYLRVSYESFIAAPRSTLDRISAFLEKPKPDGSLFSAPNRAVLLGNHAFSANRNRLVTGEVDLVPDLEWKSCMRARDRALVTALTLPLLHRYGYGVLTGGRA